MSSNKTTPHCCILHHFYNSASKNPNKISVIHAHGGAQLAGLFNLYQTSVEQLVAVKAVSSNPPVYQGDECFTFAEIVAAVENLSCRIRNVVSGGYDPALIRPALGNHGKQSFSDHISVSVDNASSSVQSSVQQNSYTPRILGIYMVPSVEYIIAVLSVMRCGKAFMPIDPSWTDEKISMVVSSSKADFVIGPAYLAGGRRCHQLDKARELVEYIRCPFLYVSMKDNLPDHFGPSNVPYSCENERSRQFCYVMHTSGSTGKPKGVCGTELGLLNRLLWMQGLYPLYGEELLLFKTSISFIDHLQEFLAPLLTGCTLVIPPFQELKNNPLSVVNYLKCYSIARLVAVPSLMRIILPTLESPRIVSIQDSMKLLVLSGEIFHLSLWNKLSELLPKTTILNLYGSTEVTGDCTYFDCQRLPSILQSEELSTVPIGIPISGCDVYLVGEDVSSEGEIHVSGVCIASGYMGDSSLNSMDYVKVSEESIFGITTVGSGSRYFYKTGDFARRLKSGDLVFIGRKDRLVKVNGQRISLEEIENILREHRDVIDAAVILREPSGEGPLLEGYIVTKEKDGHLQISSSIRNWMAKKVPLVMIPSKIFCLKSLPTSSTGKVDYTLLADTRSCATPIFTEAEGIQSSDLLHVIKKAFCNALMVEVVSDDDDFFSMGGDSISAAHAAYNIGIDMRLLYTCRSAKNLNMALSEQAVFRKNNDIVGANAKADILVQERNTLLPADTDQLYLDRSELLEKSLTIHCNKYTENPPLDGLQMDSYIHPSSVSPRNLDLWTSSSVWMSCSFGRGNRSTYGEEYESRSLCKPIRLKKNPAEKVTSLQELWKVHLESCVDASPLLVVREEDIFLYIGSHSCKFLCIDGRSGFVKWMVKLKGRIECSAITVDDFHQVVVGCYEGNIYFLDSLNGNFLWTLRTGGEVKSQPVEDKCRHLVWCGSYDHNIYALDYRGYCCVYKLFCGGSIYGSPVIDEVHNKLYVAATSGLMTAISLKDKQFSKLWLQDLGAPIFGSLFIDSDSGNVICSLVNGTVVAMDANGSIIWKARTDGPIFAGPCVSEVLPSQVLICSRNGSIYSFELGTGRLLWEHDIKDPITSSAYVDESIQIVTDPSHLSERLICVCGSSGNINVLKIMLEADEKTSQPCKYVIQDFVRLDLQGDIFSSPVMIGGRIFVGCRDDSVHCIGIKGLYMLLSDQLCGILWRLRGHTLGFQWGILIQLIKLKIKRNKRNNKR
ncbi:putative acyl-activating enzyme 19 [Heracleum sosnowskyi]|uniref:Acyl-activating enzyme 19 n=1 Tax=Heracleum sosnowskyi TaxID=360622 RepID=A0AAD8NBD1_9APIA|nr:putative acyl-activating enzyme 19 [Heracleum sosnowskyi]